MNNFCYYAPTKVIFGKGVEENVGAETKAWGAKKVLLVYGGKSAAKSGLLDRVESSLSSAGVEYLELGGVVPNPRLSLVRKGISLCRSEGVDFLLAVGGGSVIDTCKAIGLGLANPDKDVWDFYIGKAVPAACYPIGVVLTIAAAGSETSNSTVITNEETGRKMGPGFDVVRPKFAFMNPELTVSLPAFQVACGVTDILMHTIERYFSGCRGNDMTDRIAEALMKNVFRYGKRCVDDPTDYQARSEVMWSGSLSHNTLTGLGMAGSWGCHIIEHELSALFDVAHGAGLAAIWCSWARFTLDGDLNRFVQYAVNVWDVEIDPLDLKKTAIEGIDRTEEFFRFINMPTTLGALVPSGVTDEQILHMAYEATNHDSRRLVSIVTLGTEEIAAILHMANK